MLDVLRTVPRAQVVAAALALVKTPYVLHARVPGVGLDCPGVPIVVARQLGLVPPGWDITGYTASPDGTITTVLDGLMPRTAHPRPGDVPVFRWGAGRAQHMGVLVPYLGRTDVLAIVHALGPLAPARVLLTRLLPNMHLVATYRLPGVVDDDNHDHRAPAAEVPAP